MSRKPIGRSLRFLVLRRDRFTCQYCGAQAPDVQLEVDHIDAVADGGGNDPENLISACFDCNRGKRHRSLQPHEYKSGFDGLARSYLAEAEIIETFCEELPLWGDL